MSKKVYDHIQIEEKWLKQWSDQQLFQHTAQRDLAKEKIYLLYAFAYPSGSGLHVGHVEPKTALDILARFHRMSGKQVFFPVGWDAFGLPAENYAVKTGVPPAATTKEAINTFRTQVKRLGISYDWANEIATNHPEYYKWTQWLFLQLFKKGLAYRGKGMVNWCPSCQTVLANEQVVNGECERCGSEVVQKEMEQWFFKITKYQDELISGLDQVDWPEPTKQQQLNWIGKSEGVQVKFPLVIPAQAGIQSDSEKYLEVFTTRIDTIFGVTFLAVSPEQFEKMQLIELVADSKKDGVKAYLEKSRKKTEEERKIGEKEKTGVDSGLKVTNPVNGEAIPVFVADYVLGGYGTGALMGVPAHDQRDWEFAQKFNLEIKQVISNQELVEFMEKQVGEKVERYKQIQADPSYGKLINSGEFTDLASQEAMKQIPKEFSEMMKVTTTYKLRDWLISRQRYWGAPIPIVYDPEGNPHPVKEEHLPWTLPTDVEFKPTGESPLTHSQEFKERTEKLYGKGWRPEYDTMDTFVDSSWYYLRYTDARNQDQFASESQMKAWLPVDFYMIGPEHIVLHLLYSRFFTKFLRDEGYLSFDEPFMKMRHQGMILGPDGRKMSKSKGNVINPDEVIQKYGADTLRVYEMFMGPIDADKPWNTSSVVGIYRFLNRVHQLVTQWTDPGDYQAEKGQLRQKLHATIAKLTNNIPHLKFNTAIAALMELVNLWEETKGEGISKADVTTFIKLLAPFAPFLAEELWQVMGEAGSVHTQVWPSFDSQLLIADQITIAVQINGKLRAEITVSPDEVTQQSQVEATARENSKIKNWLEKGTVRKVIYVPGKLLNFVVN